MFENFKCRLRRILPCSFCNQSSCCNNSESYDNCNCYERMSNCQKPMDKCDCCDNNNNSCYNPYDDCQNKKKPTPTPCKKECCKPERKCNCCDCCDCCNDCNRCDRCDRCDCSDCCDCCKCKKSNRCNDCDDSNCNDNCSCNECEKEGCGCNKPVTPCKPKSRPCYKKSNPLPVVKCPCAVFLSSGCEIELESECGEAANSALIGQGRAIDAEPIYSPICLTPEEQSTAVTLPRGGCVNSFAASLMLSKAPCVESGTVYAVMLVDSCGCGTFKVLPSAVVKLSPKVNKCADEGAVYSACISPNCVVTGGSRVLVAFYLLDDKCNAHVCGYANASFCVS